MMQLDRILGILKFESYKKASSAPGWRGQPPKMRKSRTPFQGRGKRYGKQTMTIEEFVDKDERDERFAELRAAGVAHVSKFSDVRDCKDIWCVVRP